MSAAMNTPPQPPPSGPHTRAPGPRLLWSLITIGVGILIGIVAAVAVVVPLAKTFTSTEYPVPGRVDLSLRHTRYIIYQYVGSRSFFDGDPNHDGLVQIPLSAVIVTAPDGSTVRVTRPLNEESLTSGGRDYEGVLEFDAPAKGEYHLVFEENAFPATQVVVSRTLEDVVRGVLAWIGIGALGGLVLIAGVVMLIVGIVRRAGAKRRAYAGWGQPPQWGPGPPPQWGPGPNPQWPPGPPPQWGPPPQQEWGAPPAQPWAPPPGAPPPPPAGPPPHPPSEQPPAG
jgi:hypothetical protein